MGMVDINKITHICLVDPSILISWTSPYPILGVSGVLFHCYFISNRYFCSQTVTTLTRHSAASDLALYCLPMYQKWDASLYGLSSSISAECHRASKANTDISSDL